MGNMWCSPKHGKMIYSHIYIFTIYSNKITQEKWEQISKSENIPSMELYIWNNISEIDGVQVRIDMVEEIITTGMLRYFTLSTNHELSNWKQMTFKTITWVISKV